MIYHLALASGMTIVERHSHTLDLNRADAAEIAQGYKDLRLASGARTPW
jgi:vancomycin resistance protein YoaR